ncbi:ran GTPase-activating protein 1-like [Branchiostoma floridae]|uniref:Ran GTPase-activating protein 1-like n=1 Tax=Branchiostoma floridae TaxID=7739 RepID=A0A9J7N8Z1_BRAFL|nr:ran GTPase-activating protein 1-like [Branchiostoma floridae]
MVDVLGSLSDDEGDDIDDEEDEEGEGEEEEEEEGEAVDDPELQVRGTAITPTRENQSPLKPNETEDLTEVMGKLALP